MLFALTSVVLVFLLTGVQRGEQVTTQEPFANTSIERPLEESATSLDAVRNGWMNTSATQDANRAPRFRVLSKEPVAGAMAFNTQQALVRYTLKTNGKSYETPLATVSEATEWSKEPILRVHDAEWSRGGSGVVTRFFNSSYERVFAHLNYLPRSTSSSTAIQEARNLPNEVTSVSFSPDGESLFFLVADIDGTVGYLESVESGNRVEVWSSPLRGLTATWPTQEQILIYANPSLHTEGAVWLLNSSTWDARVVLSDQHALAASMSGDGASLLYSLYEHSGNIYSLRVLDLADSDVTYVPLPTFVEKCVWGKQHTKYAYCAIPKNMNSRDLLDNWYKGVVRTDDVIWRIDTHSGVIERILDARAEVNMPFDMIDLSVDQNDSYLVFRNKRDDSLWAVELPTITTPPPTTPEDRLFDE